MSYWLFCSRQAPESIKRLMPSLNIRGNLCDTCVIVLMAPQLPVGIIEHSLHRRSESWMKYSSVVGPKVNGIGVGTRIILATLASFKVIIWKSFTCESFLSTVYIGHRSHNRSTRRQRLSILTPRDTIAHSRKQDFTLHLQLAQYNQILNFTN